VAVADNGIGIAPENQKKIFERFYRVEDDPAVYEVSGTGLGLAISLSLIQMHEGEIALESALGKGSIFTFSIPLFEGALTEDVGELPPRIIDDPKATILVVEDDRESADLLKIMLQKGDVEFLTATSGEDALHIAREKLPDLISLDIRLPGLDGFEVLQLLKRDAATADIPVVIITVSPDRERGLRLGAAEYFIKPLDEKRLREVIVRLLDKQHPVVVADDDREALDRLRGALQLQGLDVHTARRGECAIQLVQDVEPDVVLLDHRLPDMDSARILDQLKQVPGIAEIPAIVMTEDAKLAGGSVSALETLDSVRFLTKPFSVEEFAERISCLINGNGA
jgi:CheY-like chemotaxis protein